MHLIQIFLPLATNAGQPVSKERFDEVRRELTERFGGMTGHTRAPVEGLWKDAEEQTTRDDIVIFEVMAPSLDRGWWHEYRQQLAISFEQQEILVRAQAIELL